MHSTSTGGGARSVAGRQAARPAVSSTIIFIELLRLAPRLLDKCELFFLLSGDDDDDRRLHGRVYHRKYRVTLVQRSTCMHGSLLIKSSKYTEGNELHKEHSPVNTNTRSPADKSCVGFTSILSSSFSAPSTSFACRDRLRHH